MSKFWEEFGNYFKDINVQYIEMYKEKLYTFKDDKIVLKDDLEEYFEVIKKSPIRNIKYEIRMRLKNQNLKKIN